MKEIFFGIFVLVFLFVLYFSGKDTYNSFKIKRHLRNSKLDNQDYSERFQSLVYDYHDIILDELNIKEYEPDAIVNFEKITKGMIDLGDLYREGIPDYYTKHHKVLGIKPHIEEALSWYSKSVEYGNDEGLIRQGEIYQTYINNGHPTSEDLKMAKQFYIEATKSDNNHIRNLSYQKLVSMNSIENRYMGINDSIVNERFGHIDDLNSGYYMGDRSNPIPGELGENTNQLYGAIDDLPPAILTAEAQEAFMVNVIPLAITNGRDINDTQNTHDHSVVKLMKNNYNKLKENVENPDLVAQGSITADTPISHVTGEAYEEKINEDVIKKVYALIKYRLKDNKPKQEDALKVLKRIGETSTIISGTDDTLLGTLGLVFQRIENTKSGLVKRNLKENLINHLVESVEHGHVICTRGIFNKIMDVFTVTDPEMEVARPMWVLRNEIMSKASAVRKKLEEIKDPSVPDFDIVFQTELTNQLYNDYIATNILDEKVLKTEIERLKLLN